MPTALITHPDCRKHDMGAGHPEQPARIGAILDRLIAAGIEPHLKKYDAPIATREQLLRAHTPAYLDDVFENAPQPGETRRLDPDTAMNEHSLAAALRAAGALVLATDLVMKGEVENAFCAVRPPGHHALSNRSMGFCIFGNAVIGARQALEQHKLKRVCVLDFDVHHGNGTEEMIANDARIFLCSSFQHPFYPFQGADTVSDHIVNTPLEEGSGGEEFRKAVNERWLPALDKFKPEMVFVSAGFDAHRDDPLAGLNFVEADYAWVTREIVALAKRHAGGRIVSCLEGGYDLQALGRSAGEHVRVLAGL
jgi:acetoin utilization deacetylase AcuC-like enzyme